MILYGDPTLVTIDALQLICGIVRCSERLYGTSDCPQAIAPGEAGSRSSRHRALLNPRVGPDWLHACRLSIRAVYTSTSGAVWDQIPRELEFPCDGDRQTDRQTDRQAGRQTALQLPK